MDGDYTAWAMLRVSGIPITECGTPALPVRGGTGRGPKSGFGRDNYFAAFAAASPGQVDGRRRKML